jgi:hypothetical protein
MPQVSDVIPGIVQIQHADEDLHGREDIFQGVEVLNLKWN